MLNSAGLSGNYESLHHGLWAECANTATKLANIAAPSNKSPPHNQFFKMTPPFVFNLRVFGEIGIVNDAAPLWKSARHKNAWHNDNGHKQLLQYKALSFVIFYFYEIKISVIEKSQNDIQMTQNSMGCLL